MTTIRTGLYVSLNNRSTNRVVFSAATSELSYEAFKNLWDAVGKSIYDGAVNTDEAQNPNRWMNQYELRIEPIAS